METSHLLARHGQQISAISGALTASWSATVDDAQAALTRARNDLATAQDEHARAARARAQGAARREICNQR